MRLNSKILASLIIVFIFGGMGLASAFGLWQTETEKIPAKFAEGEAAGQYNPEDIRGSYGFADISQLFDIPLEVLAKAFELPDTIDPNSFKNKDLELLYEDKLPEGQEIGNQSVQLFVALYKGLPFEITEDIYLPQQAVRILRSQAALSEAQLAYLDAHAIILGQSTDQVEMSTDQQSANENPANVEGVSVSESDQASFEAEEHEEGEVLIKGKTTFQEVLDWGVSREAIEKIIGGDLPNALTAIKDYCLNEGLEFSQVKLELENLISD
jgi:hypothetical protein